MRQTNTTQVSDKQLAATSPAQLAQLWAKRYVISVEEYNEEGRGASLDSRPTVVEYLTPELRSASSKAWNLTESLLAQEVKRHRLNANLIDPWSVIYGMHGLS